MFQLKELSLPYQLNLFEPKNLVIESASLEANPLGDPSCRHNYVLLPKKTGDKSLPAIFHLSGYFSTGHHSFYEKSLQPCFAREVDFATQNGLAPNAIHVFVDASTFWGGSQFLNSPGCGAYTDYILKELVPAVTRALPASSEMGVMGGSSGGYGALHLISQENSPFTWAFAVAPDSFFEASLLPEIWKMAPSFLKYSASLKEVRKDIDNNELQAKKSFFPLVHGIAMGLCYSPATALQKDGLHFPIDLNTGKVDSEVWQHWLQQDPIHFLPQRNKFLKNKKIYLEVGRFDNFSLQFGARQIHQTLEKMGVSIDFQEFNGDHFGLRARRLGFLSQLNAHWS
jgi:enterochelin esterase-like enzyme